MGLGGGWRLWARCGDLRSLERRQELVEREALRLARSVRLDHESGLPLWKRVLWELGKFWGPSYPVGLSPCPHQLFTGLVRVIKVFFAIVVFELDIRLRHDVLGIARVQLTQLRHARSKFLVRKANMWHQDLVVPLEHLDHGKHVLLGKPDDLVALGLLLARGVVTIERPVGPEIHDTGLL